ncbi:MAG: hypothetical protein V6Z82_02540 [Flavobacteriales bacterium]
MKREMTQNEILRYALGELSYRGWDNYRMKSFFDWCVHWAVEKCMPLRPMVLDKVLYNWYCQQWNEDVEKSFYCDFEDYFRSGVEDCERFRDILESSFVEELKERYPGPIFKMIRKAYNAKIHGENS